MKRALEIYKDNIEFLETVTKLAYETRREFYNLWSDLLKPSSAVRSVLQRKYEEEESVEGIQKKALHFLSKLYGLSKGDQSKQLSMYKIGEGLGYDSSETVSIVETLSRAEMLRRDKSSDRVTITPYGIMTIRGEITVGYAPIH